MAGDPCPVNGIPPPRLFCERVRKLLIVRELMGKLLCKEGNELRKEREAMSACPPQGAFCMFQKRRGLEEGQFVSDRKERRGRLRVG